MAEIKQCQASGELLNRAEEIREWVLRNEKFFKRHDNLRDRLLDTCDALDREAMNLDRVLEEMEGFRRG